MSEQPILLITSNGTGMGHLARMTALSHAITSEDFAPTSAVYLMSMSTATNLVLARSGLAGEYFPSYTAVPITQAQWHRQLHQRVTTLIRTLRPLAVVFDGVAPYLGLRTALAEHPATVALWSRRGMWKPGANSAALSASASFDAVVEPGDLAVLNGGQDRGLTATRTDAERIAPITMLGRFGAARLPRPEAAAALGVDPNALVALVTLGVLSNAQPGAAPQRDSPAEVAIQTILAHADWQVVVTKSPLQDAHERLDPRVRVLTGIFPLAAHLSAIDLAVSASGYNSVHELIPARVPTIFVPNPRTRTDDQVTRAFALAAAGLAVAVNEADTGRLAEEVTSVCHRSRRSELSARCAGVAELDGAREFADLIAHAITTGPSPVRRRANRSLKVAKLRASGARVAHLARLRD